MDASPKPRLIVLTSTYPRWEGDPEPGFVHELAKRLTAEFSVTVLCPHAAGSARRESMEGVEVIRYRYAPDRLETLVNDGGIVTNLKQHPWKWLLVPGFIICLLWQAWRMSKRLRPSAIHAHWLLPQGLVAAIVGSSSRVPFMVTSHGADLFALQSRPFQSLKRFVVNRASAVTVVSEAMRDELDRIGANTTKVRVISMGVDLQQRFTPDPTQVRSNHQILFVGRLVEKKGLRYLIDAMPAILKRAPQAVLVIAGFGPEEGERRSQVNRLGLQDCVQFHGPVPQSQLPEMYRRAAVLAAPFVTATGGDREGLGLVVIEATGCGCPIVTTTLPSAREIFDNKELACCVEPASAGALAEGVVRILASQEDARRKASALRSKLLPRFDWEATAAAHVCLLKELAPHHS